jgi:hypothetical protein
MLIRLTPANSDIQHGKIKVMEPFIPEDKQNQFRNEIETIINKHGRENTSDTPDFILAEYLTDCLASFDKAVRERERWYGRYVLGAPGAPGERPFPRAGAAPPTRSTERRDVVAA